MYDLLLQFTLPVIWRISKPLQNSQKVRKFPILPFPKTKICFSFQYSRSVIPVAKSVNKKRIEENIDIFDFKLNDEEIAAIAKFDKKLRVIDFKDWKDYPYFPFEY